ncbi:MAG TPA: Ig-like domain repeat protein, partial [bacterium]|nr:Ig-like domain repeat protein [bacterium]
DEYYLILKVEDNAGNISAAQTVFTYRFDKTAPEQPTNVWIYSQYGSPPPAPVLSPSTWYNYSDPFIDWEASIDVGSGLSGYYVVFATDSSYFYMDFDETMVFASAYDVGVRGPNLQSGGKYRLYLRAVDRARINPNISPLFTIIASEYWYDGTNPQTTINSPLAAQWQGADFALDVTNSDYIPGSGPTNCLIRVVSNLSQTLDWTAYDCATDPMITVGDTGGEYCDVEGEDVCQISLRVSDLAGNGPVETSRIYKIDWAPPIVTINSPAASSWQSADFLVDTTNFDSGSGVFVCEMKVVSGATETLNWSAYDCASDPTVTVGYSGVEYCAEEGEDICEVFFRATDRAGNISSVASRLFSVDWAPPATTINSPDASSWQRDDFVIDVTNFDSGSGVDVCEYKVTSDSVETLAWTVYDCATDPTISVGDSGGENCATLGADICQVSFRVTDRAGNLSLTTTRLFGIDWILPIVTIVSPDASSWQSADFLVDITNFDAHSGVLTCEVMAVSGATETLSWTAYDCASDPTATVGDTGGEYCDVEGDDACALSFRAVDRAGNISATATRAFSIDWAPPAATINAPAASSWQRDDFIVDV